MIIRKMTLLLVILLAIVSSAVAGRPEITEVYFNSGVLTVNYSTGGETLWLGASVRDDDGDIMDLSPRRVSGSGSFIWTIGVPGMSSSRYEEGRVSLWEGYDSSRDIMTGERKADTHWFRLATGWR